VSESCVIIQRIPDAMQSCADRPRPARRQPWFTLACINLEPGNPLSNPASGPALLNEHAPTVSGPQQAILFRIYCGYRLVLSGILATILLLTRGDPLVGRSNPELFGWICFVYGVAMLALLIFAPRRRGPGTQATFFHLFMDIGVLTALTHLSGGSGSGLALLLLIDVATAGLMLSGQLAALVAALASIALLADTIYLGLNRSSDQNFLTAGMLGILFFAAAAGFHLLRNMQLLAQARGVDVSKLQSLNQLIVQRMRTGILVVNHNLQVVTMNQAATEMMHASLLERAVERGQLPTLPEPLNNKLANWRRHPDAKQKPFTIAPSGTELMARFTSLTPRDPHIEGSDSEDTLIFLEDNLQLAQRAQQLKLAALGRLTASIAHEIRNPLGAISHAAQLLRESPDLSFTDQRLADIIQNHSQRMNSVIENVLQLSRRSPPNPQRLDLGLWLADIAQQYRQGNPKACSIDINVSGDIDVTVDPDQLAQVLTNLIDNALRYSERATGKPRVELIGSLDPNNFPQLDIVDDGPGIPTELQERVFEPFFTTEVDGNGLGLYISRELCEINQARLHYLHNVAGRSCFRINFSHPDRKPLINE
jgi:two-component system sensor histidine kinase PilS (NtrC family)